MKTLTLQQALPSSLKYKSTLTSYKIVDYS